MAVPPAGGMMAFLLCLRTAKTSPIQYWMGDEKHLFFSDCGVSDP